MNAHDRTGLSEHAHPRRDWSARVRSSSMDALRYTQFVGVMKRALPTAAFAVIAAVLVFFFAARQPAKVAMTYARLDAIKNDLTMIKPHLTGAANVIVQAEVDQDSEVSPLHHKVVPLLETFRPGSGKHRGAQEVAACQHRGHRSHRGRYR